MAGKYKKCPRCELNYILADQDLCQVCLTELKLAPSDDEEEDMELCTLCGKNLITVDQVMCDECAKRRSIDDVVDEGEEEQEDVPVSDWDTASIEEVQDDLGGIVDADDDVEVVSFSDLEDEEFDEEDDMYEGENEDDFDFSDIDSDDDFDDEEDDDEDDDEDDFLMIKKKK